MATPKKFVSNFEKCCRLCLKNLEFSKNGKVLLSKRRDLTSQASLNLLQNLQEFVPKFQPEAGKSYLCLECVNKINRYERIKCKYLTVKSEYELEKDTIANLCVNTSGERVKRVLLTPHRPKSIPKLQKQNLNENLYPLQGSSKIPVLTRPNKESVDQGSINIPQRFYNSPSKIPVLSRENKENVDQGSIDIPMKFYNSPSKIPVPLHKSHQVCIMIYAD